MIDFYKPPYFRVTSDAVFSIISLPVVVVASLARRTWLATFKRRTRPERRSVVFVDGSIGYKTRARTFR